MLNVIAYPRRMIRGRSFTASPLDGKTVHFKEKHLPTGCSSLSALQRFQRNALQVPMMEHHVLAASMEATAQAQFPNSRLWRSYQHRAVTLMDQLTGRDMGKILGSVTRMKCKPERKLFEGVRDKILKLEDTRRNYFHQAQSVVWLLHSFSVYCKKYDLSDKKDLFEKLARFLVSKHEQMNGHDVSMCFASLASSGFRHDPLLAALTRKVFSALNGQASSIQLLNETVIGEDGCWEDRGVTSGKADVKVDNALLTVSLTSLSKLRVMHDNFEEKDGSLAAFVFSYFQACVPEVEKRVPLFSPQQISHVLKSYASFPKVALLNDQILRKFSFEIKGKYREFSGEDLGYLAASFASFNYLEPFPSLLLRAIGLARELPPHSLVMVLHGSSHEAWSRFKAKLAGGQTKEIVEELENDIKELRSLLIQACEDKLAGIRICAGATASDLAALTSVLGITPIILDEISRRTQEMPKFSVGDSCQIEPGRWDNMAENSKNIGSKNIQTEHLLRSTIGNKNDSLTLSPRLNFSPPILHELLPAFHEVRGGCRVLEIIQEHPTCKSIFGERLKTL